MKSLEFFAVTSQQVTQHPTHVIKIEGQFLGVTAAAFLQVHDSEVVAAEGAVPLRQWVIDTASPFLQNFAAGELALAHGLYICISTADGTKALSADTMNLAVELPDPEVSGITTVGDETTALNGGTLAVWADGAGPKTLFRLIINEKHGTAGFIFLFPNVGKTPVFLGKVVANGRKELNFGVGCVPFLTDGAGVIYNGCIIKVYEDLAHSISATGKATVMAEYKA